MKILSYVEDLKLIKEIVRGKYFSYFIVISLVLIFLFLFISFSLFPTQSIIDNFLLFPIQNYLIIILFSLLTSLLIVLNLYSRDKSSLGLGLGASLIGGITGVAFCSSCLITIFSFLGLGVVSFLSENLSLILISSFLLLIYSIHLTLKNIRGVCEEC